MNRLFTFILLTAVSIFIIYVLYNINLYAFLIYLSLGVRYAVEYAIKISISRNTDNKFANYIFSNLVCINWLLMSMFDLEL